MQTCFQAVMTLWGPSGRCQLPLLAQVAGSDGWCSSWKICNKFRYCEQHTAVFLLEALCPFSEHSPLLSFAYVGSARSVQPCPLEDSDCLAIQTVASVDQAEEIEIIRQPVKRGRGPSCGHSATVQRDWLQSQGLRHSSCSAEKHFAQSLVTGCLQV